MGPNMTQVKMFDLVNDMEALQNMANDWLRENAGQIDVKETRPISVVFDDDNVAYFSLVITYVTFYQPPRQGPGGMTLT